MANQRIESWMFREKYEMLFLIFALLTVILLGLLIADYNLYLFVSAVLFGFFYIKIQQSQLIGNALEINSMQFENLYEMFKKHMEQLGLKKVKMYITQDPNPNAYTIGFPHASIILTSSLVENFTVQELDFTIAHELGHVKAGHNFILTLFFPLGNGVPGASTIFSFWRRKAEYTADKCGLILSKNIESATSSLLKVAIGLNLAKNIKLEGYRDQLLNSRGFMVRIGETLLDHPLTTNRINKLVLFWRKNFIYK